MINKFKEDWPAYLSVFLGAGFLGLTILSSYLDSKSEERSIKTSLCINKISYTDAKYWCQEHSIDFYAFSQSKTIQMEYKKAGRESTVIRKIVLPGSY